jgi:hypothetical protein
MTHITEEERARIQNIRNMFRDHSYSAAINLAAMREKILNLQLGEDEVKAIDSIITLLDYTSKHAMHLMDRKSKVLRATIGKPKPAGE